MITLAIESSCDESSCSILSDTDVLATRTETQSVHAQYGGVVPELAGRSHLELLPVLAHEALCAAGVNPISVDLFAATRGPGLVGSLLVGTNFCRGLALAANKPFRGIHHIEAHLWSPEIEHGQLPLPFLGLVASGGHTLLVEVLGLREYRLLGSTIDDAVGEAFDKVGKLGGLPFPAGASLDSLAEQGNPRRFKFAVPMQDNSYDFSFSGLKTAFLYALRDLGGSPSESDFRDLFAAFREAAVQSIVLKTRRAISTLQPRALLCAGGVAANSLLRTRLSSSASASAIPFYYPALQYCGDNAAMIGYLAYKLERAAMPDANDAALPRWPLDAVNVTTIQ
ncbi:tRNA (adenosine(37)-N6)-threonylcarbamoyltransferase complex transferase subunit TsaD [candidate division KSB1 bacterium]|nr:tRNA (adenosine(37)-N6)-threonylcarbamoyltransferase complex transferase subunit TsaD [candidate division KSB1 bacterium]